MTIIEIKIIFWNIYLKFGDFKFGEGLQDVA